jgi:hypothetical protein
MEMKTDNNSNKINEFTMIVRGLINSAIFYIAFTFGNVRRLDLNDKFIYLWQNVKGDVHYSFSIFEKEYYTTSAAKLGNVLSQHFGVEVEVVNNRKEHLKKILSATTGLNKALSDFEKFNYFKNFSDEEQVATLPKNSNIIAPKKEELLEILDSKPNNTALQIKQSQSLPQNPQHYLHNQEKLYDGAIQLSTYYLDAHIGTIYIRLDDLPNMQKEAFEPRAKQAFFPGANGLNYRNKFVPTPCMVYPYNLCEPNQSFIMIFILFMAKNDIHQAFKILLWLTEAYRLNKLDFALVLHSQDDKYMKLFFEELLESLFHDFQCEKIDNEAIEDKALASTLDEKYIYNFHNISVPSILGEASHELTNKLIHKDINKINRKSITTVANIVISSTSKYIPMINEDVPCSIVEVDSNIDALCKYINIRPNKNTISKYIKNDIPNFVSILRALDLQALNNAYPVVNQNIPNNLLDGDTDATMVFDRIIRDKDITPFKSIARTNAEKKLVEEMEDNFSQNRIDKAHLLNYFELLFGNGIYRSNRALIETLKNDYSSAGEPFDNLKTHVRKGRAYYFL